MRAHMTWLDEAEKRSFVEEALAILQRVGVEAQGIGRAAGARGPGG